MKDSWKVHSGSTITNFSFETISSLSRRARKKSTGETPETASASTSPATLPLKRCLFDITNDQNESVPLAKKPCNELYTLTNAELSWTNFIGLCQTLYDNFSTDSCPDTTITLFKIQKLCEDGFGFGVL